MKQINRFFAMLGIIMLGILSVVFDLAIAAVGIALIAAMLAVVAVLLLPYGTGVLVGKAIKSLR